MYTALMVSDLFWFWAVTGHVYLYYHSSTSIWQLRKVVSEGELLPLACTLAVQMGCVCDGREEFLIFDLSLFCRLPSLCLPWLFSCCLCLSVFLQTKLSTIAQV